MNIQEFIDKSIQKAQAEHDEKIKSIQQEREQILNEGQKILHDQHIPDETDTLDILTSRLGKMVVISTSEDGWIRSPQPFQFNPQTRIVTIKGHSYCPLIGDDYIEKIVDKEKRKTIYHNPYGRKGYSIPLQTALMLGKKAGLERIQSDLNGNKEIETAENKNLESAISTIKQAPELIERGEKIIYPQLYKNWQECVKSSVTGSDHGMIIKNALEIMEALEVGKSLAEAKELVDGGHSGGSYAAMVKIVTEYSKRGAEFSKAFSTGYLYACATQNKAQMDSWEESFKRLQERNDNFAAELEKGPLS